jgi:hypothetical protein
MNLGPTPDVTISSISGDCEVRGVNGVETLIVADGNESDASESDGAFSASACGGDCVMRLPEGGKLRIGDLGGDMSLKGVYGEVSVDHLGGDFAARRCGSLVLGRVGGDAVLREVEGDLALGMVGGDCALQECAELVRIDEIGGDCTARDVSAGIEVGRVKGDLSIRTSIRPGATFTANANGDLEFAVPADSSIRIIVPSESNLSLGRGLTAVNEGEKVIITLGGGEATAELSARGTVRIRLDEEYNRSREHTIGMDRDFDNYMVDVSAQIDSHLRGLERHLDDLPERVRNRVEQRLNAAIRQVVSAERQARHMAEQGDAPRGASGFARSEPISEQERLAVLKMLEEGKITVQQAQTLLAALEDEA